MNETQIGQLPWQDDDLRAAIPDFLEVYPSRPIQGNSGGMQAQHLLYTWFLARQLQPTHIVESGVWKGQGSWMLQQGCPAAKFVCIDPNPQFREYTIPEADYLEADWATHNWDELPRETTLLFFDDHQNAMERIRMAAQLGFRHLVFEDNYPAGMGDCYSPKSILSGKGFDRSQVKYGLKMQLKHLVFGNPLKSVPPNVADRAEFLRLAEVYYEFPPVVLAAATRWGTAWNQELYPTKAPLYAAADAGQQPGFQPFIDTAASYNWLCYIRLRA